MSSLGSGQRVIQLLRVFGWRVRRKVVQVVRGHDSSPLYCRALAGESDYNICVNSDMTVSCNCQDFDGTGHIGDLRSQSLEEIFSGEVVRAFQESLSARVFPTSVCSVCTELAPIPAGQLEHGPAPGRVPRKGIMVENTARCNLRCELCRRNELLALRRQPSLSLADVAQVSSMLAEYGIQQVAYFNLGEPFLSPSILTELRLIRQQNPRVRILVSTNGVLLEGEEKIQAALLTDHIYFSIDGVSQDSLERYQVGGDFGRQYGNMKSLVERRERLRADDCSLQLPLIEWKYVYFSWNDDLSHMARALELAREAGVDRLSFCPGSVNDSTALSSRSLSDPFFRSINAQLIDGAMSVELAGRSSGGSLESRT